MNELLVDTNILVYAIDEDSEFYSKSQKLLYHSDHTLFITSKNLSEFLTVVTKGPVVSLSIDDALAVLEDYINLFNILYPSEISFTIFRRLLQKYKPTGLKIHDFEIASIGLAHKINQIATLNAKDFEGIEEVQLIKF
jgi:predicted nucleic acid-binding protein